MLLWDIMQNNHQFSFCSGREQGAYVPKSHCGNRSLQFKLRAALNTGHVRTRTLKGEDFLWLLIQHTLPKGFRRARNYGFLHPNSKNLIRVLQVLLLRSGLLGPEPKRSRAPIVCSHCGGGMVLVALGLPRVRARRETEPNLSLLAPVM